MGVDVMCYSLLDSVEEGRSFCLGPSLFLFNAGRHPLHMHLQRFGSQGCKDVLEWSLLSSVMWLRRSQFSRVCQNMEKEWYASFESQSYGTDGCSSSQQCTGNGIGCGLGRLSDELLWHWF